MSRRHPGATVIPGDNEQWRASLARLRDNGENRDALREAWQVLMEEYGIPTTDLKLQQLNSPLTLKKRGTP